MRRAETRYMVVLRRQLHAAGMTTRVLGSFDGLMAAHRWMGKCADMFEVREGRLRRGTEWAPEFMEEIYPLAKAAGGKETGR